MKKEIKITGVKPAEKSKTVFGYSVCRQWRDNPSNVEVWEYADSKQEAQQIIKGQKKDDRFKWFVGVYQ